jgi:signal transduction histidine kinase
MGDAASQRRRTDQGGDGSAGARRRPTGRWRFLADASAVLDGSLDFEQTLANTVRLAVPEVSDYCVVALSGEDGSCRWAHASHRDEAGRAMLDRAHGRFPLPPTSNHPLVRAMRTGEPEIIRVERERAHLDEAAMAGPGPLGPVSAIVTPMFGRGRTLGAIFFAATARSQRRYGARDLELAMEVGRRAGSAIDHALLYRAAEQAARLRENLMAIVAHDLKNPVATIDLALKVLLEDDHDHFPDDGEHRIERHAIGTIQRAAGRMYRLIHDLLDLSRADEGRLAMHMAAVDPVSLIADALDAHSTLAAARETKLEAAAEPDLPAVLADRERVAQVFSNLVGNALQFTSRGGHVRISALPSGASVRFVVEDNGPGIAPDHIGLVFDRFWQAQNRKRGGTGLGLSIAKAIVEAHGGSIGVESTLGIGARFHFDLPAVGATDDWQEPCRESASD